jgi:hypothetical protein
VAAGHPAEARLRQIVLGSQRFVPCGEDRVGEEFRVVWIDRLRRDRDLVDLASQRRYGTSAAGAQSLASVSDSSRPRT